MPSLDSTFSDSYLPISLHRNASKRLSILANACLPFYPKPTPIRLLPLSLHQNCASKHHWAPAIKLNSQLLVLNHLTSRRSNGSGHRSFLFGFLSSLGLYTVLSWFSSNPLAAPPSPFLFSSLPPNPVIVIQAWRFSPRPPLFSFYILSLLSLEALNTPCFCLICALQSPSLLLRHKDTLHFLLLVCKSFICKTWGSRSLEFRLSQPKER